MKKFAFFLCAMLAISFYACNKEGASVNENIESSDINFLAELKNDVYIEFPTIESFFEVIENIGNEGFSEFLITKSQTTGFVSFRQVYDEFIDKINCEDLTEQEFYVLLDEYKDVLTIEEDRIVPRINNPLVSSLISRNGLVKIGNELAIYTEKEKIVAIDGDINTLIKALSSNVESDNVYRFAYNLEQTLEKSSHCGSFQRAWFTRADHERRARIDCNIVMEYKQGTGYSYCSNQAGGDFKTYAVTVGYPEKKNFFSGKWVNYKTINTLDLNYQARALAGTTHNVVVFRQNSSTASSITHSHLLHQGKGCWSQQGNFQGEFVRIVANKYKTDGINPNWAIIECGIY